MLWANIWLGVYKWGFNGPTFTGQAVVILVGVAAPAIKEKQASNSVKQRRKVNKGILLAE